MPFSEKIKDRHHRKYSLIFNLYCHIDRFIHFAQILTFRQRALCSMLQKKTVLNREILCNIQCLFSQAIVCNGQTDCMVSNPFPNKLWFLHVCITSLLKTLGEKEKLLVTSNFSFSTQCFLPLLKIFHPFHQV